MTWYLLWMGQQGQTIKSDVDALCPCCGQDVSFRINTGGIIHATKDKLLLMATGRTGCEGFDKLKTEADFARFARETRESAEQAVRS